MNMSYHFQYFNIASFSTAILLYIQHTCTAGENCFPKTHVHWVNGLASCCR